MAPHRHLVNPAELPGTCRSRAGRMTPFQLPTDFKAISRHTSRGKQATRRVSQSDAQCTEHTTVPIHVRHPGIRPNQSSHQPRGQGADRACRGVDGHHRVELLQNAIATARKVIADHDNLVLSAEAFDAFIAAAENPPEPNANLRDGQKLIAIGDTKWKLISPDEAGRLRPGNDDLLQMYAYAAAYGCTNLVLIYPWSDQLHASVETHLELPEVQGHRARVDVLCVDVHMDQLAAVRGAVMHGFGSLLATRDSGIIEGHTASESFESDIHP